MLNLPACNFIQFSISYASLDMKRSVFLQSIFQTNSNLRWYVFGEAILIDYSLNVYLVLPI